MRRIGVLACLLALACGADPDFTTAGGLSVYGDVPPEDMRAIERAWIEALAELVPEGKVRRVLQQTQVFLGEVDEHAAGGQTYERLRVRYAPGDNVCRSTLIHELTHAFQFEWLHLMDNAHQFAWWWDAVRWGKDRCDQLRGGEQ